eukprot:6035055-Pyramimonas_sp.AAC.1
MNNKGALCFGLWATMHDYDGVALYALSPRAIGHPARVTRKTLPPSGLLGPREELLKNLSLPAFCA